MLLVVHPWLYKIENNYKSRLRFFITLLFIHILTLDFNLAAFIWQESQVAMNSISRASDGMPVATYNGSVLLFQLHWDAEWNDLYDILEIDLSTNVATTLNNSNIVTASWGQAYSQTDSFVFMTSLTLNTILVYDLRSQTIAYDIPKCDLIHVNTVCIVANDDYLLSIGGGFSSSQKTDAVYVYSFNTAKWANGTSLPHGLETCSCNILQNQLYVIGGHTRDHIPLNSILFIDINDLNNTQLQSSTWNLFPQFLSFGRTQHRSVVYHEFILVVGGSNGTGCISNVDVIDTIKNTITEESLLLYPKCRPSVIVIDDILYSFGGFPLTRNEYYQFAAASTLTTNPSSSPTELPSVSPTELPSISPTEYPSNVPTSNPSASPTELPSNSPTQYPSTSPTSQLSTANPSILPSCSPTEDPSASSTTNPSTSPTSYPLTSYPSTLPTLNPSNSPTSAAMETTGSNTALHTIRNDDDKTAIPPNNALDTTSWVLIIIIIVTVFVIVIVSACFGGYYYSANKQKQTEGRIKTSQTGATPFTPTLPPPSTPKPPPRNTELQMVQSTSTIAATTGLEAKAIDGETEMTVTPYCDDESMCDEVEGKVNDEVKVIPYCDNMDDGYDVYEDMYVNEDVEEAHATAGATDDGSMQQNKSQNQYQTAGNTIY